MFDKLASFLGKKPEVPVSQIAKPDLEKSSNTSVSLRKISEELEAENIKKMKEQGAYETSVREDIFNQANNVVVEMISVYENPEMAENAHFLGKNDQEVHEIKSKASGRFDEVFDQIAHAVENAVVKAKEKGVDIAPIDVLKNMESFAKEQSAHMLDDYQWMGKARELQNTLLGSGSMDPDYRKEVVKRAMQDPDLNKNIKIPESFDYASMDQVRNFANDVDRVVNKKSRLKVYKDAHAKSQKTIKILDELYRDILSIEETGYVAWLSGTRKKL